MAELTLQNQLEDAYQIYRKVRDLADKQYDGYLPKRDGEAGLSEKTTAPQFTMEDAEKLKPASAVAGVARRSPRQSSV